MATADEKQQRILGEGYAEQRRRELIGSVSFYSLVVFVVIFSIAPLVWVFGQSLLSPAFKVQPDGTHNWFPSSPEEFSSASYIGVFSDSIGLTNAILNSFIIATITTILCVAIGASASYVLAQFEFNIRTALLGLILSMTMFPGIVILVPLFVQYLWISENFGVNLINTYAGIILPYIVFNLPLTVYLLFNFFQEIPKELISAARVDGASDFQIFRKVILPLAMPGVFTTAILVFIAAWNEFLFASVLVSGQERQTIPVVLALFNTLPPNNLNLDFNLAMMAATVIVTVPLIVMVLAFQKQIVSGLTAGAVKG